MDHKRCYTTLGLLIISVASSLADLRAHDQIEVTVWPGNDVDLECGDPHVGTARRFWRREDEILTAANNVIANDDRITQVNYSAILRIFNVSAEDEGDYMCVVNARPRYRRIYILHIKEFMCEVQEQPLNGGYRNYTVNGNSGSQYKLGDQIQYFCNKGHHLVGPSVRTCSGTYVGWKPEELPYCEPEFIAKLRHQLTGFESTMEEKMSKVENDMVTIETRLPEARPPNPLLNNTHVDLAEWFWSSCSNTTDTDQTTSSGWPYDESRLSGRKSVWMVSEFRWTVDNVRARISQLSTSIKEIQESRPFYARIPGYRFKLRLTLFYNSDFNLNLFVAKGEFDDQLTWPARIKYELTVVMQNGTEVLYKFFNPSVYPGCLPKRPPPDSSAGCNAPRLPQYNDFYVKKNYILSDNSINFKAYIYV